MKLTISSVLSVLIGAAHAAPESAKVYVLSSTKYNNNRGNPSLTPEEARLVLAQRLDVSYYHKLQDASSNGIQYISYFGGPSNRLFDDGAQHNKRHQLVLVVEGTDPGLMQTLHSDWGILPDFQIDAPPSEIANKKLVKDLRIQSGDISRKACGLEDEFSPYMEGCWTGTNKIIHLDDYASSKFLKDWASSLQKYVDDEAMDIILVAMPESSRKTKTSDSSYGSYDMPNRSHRRQALEEPMTELPNASPSNFAPVNSNQTSNHTLRGIIPQCHSSFDTALQATNNCSGHGEIFRKYGDKDKPDVGCYACKCVTSIDIVNGKQVFYHWGGAACQKIDISSQFWLIASFSVAIMAIIGWAIGMMFSIGQEKLPGVIGAGVSAAKPR